MMLSSEEGKRAKSYPDDNDGVGADTALSVVSTATATANGQPEISAGGWDPARRSIGAWGASLTGAGIGSGSGFGAVGGRGFITATVTEIADKIDTSTADHHAFPLARKSDVDGPGSVRAAEEQLVLIGRSDDVSGRPARGCTRPAVTAGPGVCPVLRVVAVGAGAGIVAPAPKRWIADACVVVVKPAAGASATSITTGSGVRAILRARVVVVGSGGASVTTTASKRWIYDT